MPSRRRFRLFAVVVIFVVVTIIYTRRARVHPYAGDGSEQVVGGGAVLRAGADGGNVEVPKPAARPTRVRRPPVPTREPRPATSSAAPAVETDLWGIDESTSSDAALRAAPTSTAAPAYHGLPEEDEIPIKVDEGRKAATHSFSGSQIHWSHFPERFPVSTTIQLPTGSPRPIPRIQYAGDSAGGADERRLSAIKATAQHAWNGYRDVAFGADEVKPVSGGQNNPFNGWGATLVDSLDTLWIMDMKENFEEAVKYVGTIDFTTSTRADIPLFETTIRYLGGLVAAYDISGRQTKYGILLEKSVELADVLYAAFDTPNRMPLTYYQWKPAFASQPHRAGSDVVMAELGSLSMEFTRLAQLTGEPKYFDAIQRITDAFEDWQNSTRLPGMWPTNLDASGCEKPAKMAHSASSSSGGTAAQASRADGDRTSVAAGQPGVAKGQELSAPEKQKLDWEQQENLEQLHKDRKPGTGRIIGYDNPLEEGSLDKKTKEQLTNELGSAKAKRQLDYSVTHGPSDDPEHERAAGSHQNSTALHKEETRTSPPAQDTRTGQDTCIPRGLGSSSKNGKETFTLGGQSDSTYEYLPKEYLLLGGQVDKYRTMYEYAADTVIEELLFRPMTIDERDLLISGTLRITVDSSSGEATKRFAPEAEHLTCFAGGMFALGGKIFNRPQDVAIGSKLTDGCVWAYNSTVSGIMPEIFTAVKCQDLKDCPWNQTEYWHILDPNEHIRLRPPRTRENSVPAAKSSIVVAATEVATQAPALQKGLERRYVGKAEEDEEPSQVQERDGLIGLHDEVEAKQAQSTLARRAPAAAQPLPTPSTSSHIVIGSANEPAYLRTAPQPPSHQEFVERRIGEERLPPGMVRLNSRKYILRPEAIESVFYMYRITGDQYWRDIGWQMFTAIDTHTRAMYGNAAIDDVTKDAPELKDGMESFWIAETLKYFYLLFDDPARWSLDDWVLNTEAHFFRRPT